jgi:hypothetical protein
VIDPLAPLAETALESPVWAASLLPEHERRLVTPWAALCGERFACGLEAIYEGYLAHHGRPRLFAPADGDAALLLGDFLYARGLAWIAALGDVGAIAALADLIALASQSRAQDGGADDLALWAATARFLADRSGERAFAAAKDALRLHGDAGPLEVLAAGTDLDEARELHAA